MLDRLKTYPKYNKNRHHEKRLQSIGRQKKNTFSTGIKAQKGYSEQTFVSTSGKSLSRAFISLGFTHTFGKRGKRLR